MHAAHEYCRAKDVGHCFVNIGPFFRQPPPLHPAAELLLLSWGRKGLPLSPTLGCLDRPCPCCNIFALLFCPVLSTMLALSMFSVLPLIWGKSKEAGSVSTAELHTDIWNKEKVSKPADKSQEKYRIVDKRNHISFDRIACLKWFLFSTKRSWRVFAISAILAQHKKWVNIWGTICIQLKKCTQTWRCPQAIRGEL